MRISKSALILIVSMVILSIIFATVINVISTEKADIKLDTQDVPFTIGDSDDHLIWFLQISDIHISIFQDPQRITEFKEFCYYTVNAIKPSVVLASGDLTDAKTSDTIGSQQFENEWKHYWETLTETEVPKRTMWLDVRGNHDNFNVAGLGSKENFYKHYSVQGKIHSRSYMYQIGKGKDLYSFMAVDACLEPGPRRPFNFVGILSKDETDNIKNLVKNIEGTDSNYTIWFGHFPTSCMLASTSGGSRHLIGSQKQALVYLCGHLHQLGGLVPKMYTLQKEGFLELELGDWKDNRMYRLAAIDHGIFSFVDVKHRQWPIALITNPKHALFVIPGRENSFLMKKSTHIRVIAFSLSDITSVKVKIDNDNWKSCTHKTGPLYVTEWNPNLYIQGIHYIEVFVQDSLGREQIYSQPFSLDGSRLSFQILPRIALMTSASMVFKISFVIFLGFVTLPLIVMRYMNRLVLAGKMSKPIIRRGCLQVWIRKLWILSTVDRLFYPLICYCIYLPIGPWSIGYLVEDHLGAIFAWGILVNGNFLPGSFTYAYGFVQLATFQFPLILILANGVDNRLRNLILRPGKAKTLCDMIGLHLPFIMLLSIQLLMAYFFLLAYGYMAFFLGPLRTWSIILALVLWCQTLQLPERCTRDAANVWFTTAESELSQTSLNDNIEPAS